jgi:hypothetical protein
MKNSDKQIREKRKGGNEREKMKGKKEGHFLKQPHLKN